jgi:isoleucyl-tRNA synthetase
MQSVIDVVSLGRAARNDCQIKTRQPLGEMFVPAKLKPALIDMLDLVKEEVNIHTISFVSEDDGFVQYELKPDFKVMGPKYGKLMKQIGAALSKVTGSEALQQFQNSGVFTLHLEQESLQLLPEDLVVHILPREGYVFANQKDLFVALDTRMTDALVNEGLARELINKIQFTRKDLGLEIMDTISLSIVADEEVQVALHEHRDYIMSETLCNSLELAAMQDPAMVQVDINSHEVWLLVEKQ